MTRELQTDVVIVGAGIGGAVLALALAPRGWKILLLEREAQPPRIVRPEILWSPTLTALDSLGIGEQLRLKASVRLTGVQVASREKRLLAISERNLQAAGIEPFSTDPGMTRAAIADAALATGNVTVERGVEVKEVLREGARIVGVRGGRQGEAVEVRARLVVGDDGAHSVVRSAFPSTVKLQIFPLDFVTTLIDWPAELPAREARVWLNPSAFRGRGLPALGVMPWPGGQGAALLPLPHARVEPLFQSDPASFWRELAETTPLAAVFQKQRRFPDDFKHVRRPYGHAPQYVADGAAILGDAAHPTSPAGGQGANAAIWDALALAEVAHGALTANDVSKKALGRYATLRRPRNAASLRFTEWAAWGVDHLGSVLGLSSVAPAMLRMLDTSPGLKARLMRTAGTTFVT